jgi:hypothetical protein
MKTIYILTFENNNGTTFLHAACTNLEELFRCIKLRTEVLDVDDLALIERLLYQNQKASFDISDGTIRVWQLEANTQYAIFI